MKTHRCKGSLKSELSIRYCKQYKNWDIQGDYETWRLSKAEYDSEYGVKYLSNVTEIKYCPFCGEELKGD